MQGAINGLRLREEEVGTVDQGVAALTVVGAPPRPALDLLPSETRPRARDHLSWREALDRRLLGIADLVSTALATTAMLALFGSAEAMGTAVAYLCLVLGLLKLAGLYDREELRLAPSTLDEAPRLLQQTGLAALGIAVLQPAVLPHGLVGARIAALWMASFLAIAAGRVLARWMTGHIRPVERCMILGDVDQARRIRERLAESRARARVIACVPYCGRDLEELGATAIIDEVVRDLRVDRVIIIPAVDDSAGGVDLIRIAKTIGVKVSVLPRIFDVVGSEVEFDEVNGMTLLSVPQFGLPGSSRLLKRAFDIVVAFVGLIAVAPVLAGVALAIRLDSPGPIFFRQVRVGRGGKHFRMIKFRSMVADADALKDELRSLSEPGDGLFKITDDPRVTWVGRMLRRSSLDELPQIFNVLRGEMSLVGPRPLVVEEDAIVVGIERSRLHLTPGMTGPWQVLGLRLPLPEMVEIDYRYVANWSLWLDLKTLCRTVRYVARRGNV
jgi:exopolysaccharide biosynthesis polyprenyl glycosylphosphotransferase